MSVRRVITSICLAITLLMGSFQSAHAGSVLGVHILNTGELEKAKELLKTEKTKDEWTYVTIPLTLNDLSKHDEWQQFFNNAKKDKFLPIVRLSSRFNSSLGAWEVPTHKDVVDLSKFLTSLEWPKEDEKIIIVFNEPNHAKEWGGSVDPDSYAQTLVFTADWLHSEMNNYIVLPAGLDLAAPNGKETQEAFSYMKTMLSAYPELFSYIDAWNSHSYPNPGFSSSPYALGKNSLRGYEHELTFISQYTDKEFPVYITETGWVETKNTQKWLSQYYMYAVKNIWSNERVKAVTPFVLNGAPGSFAQFSFYDEHGKPTKQFYALRKAIEEML